MASRLETKLSGGVSGLLVVPQRRRGAARFGLLALVLIALAGCRSASTEAVVDPSSQETTSEGAATTVGSPTSPTLSISVDEATAAVGSSLTVRGTGCISPSGDGTPGTAVVGVGVDFTSYDTGWETTNGTVASDGSFVATVPVDDLTPSGDQQLAAACTGPHRVDTGTSDSASVPVGPDGMFDFFSIAPPVAIKITGAVPLEVSPTTVKPSQTVHVRARCSQPGSDYEKLTAWITPTGQGQHRARPSSEAVGYRVAPCPSPTAELDVIVGADVAPGSYDVRAFTSAERVPVIRWFQPVQIEVVAP